jgi:SAM-dependent methyltransferase
MTPPSHQNITGYRRALRSKLNGLAFALRGFWRWQPPGFQEVLSTEQPQILQNNPALALKAKGLLQQYDLTRLPARSSESRLLENLTYLEWLDYFLQVRPQAFQELRNFASLNWLDVGAKNWAYVDALDAFIRRHSDTPYRLDGLELDPHRRYANLTTRAQAAKNYTQTLTHAQYHEMNALDWRRKAHIITQFMPFVSPDPHLAWGLPLNYFQPAELLNHLLGLLEPGGLLLVVNQGEWEAEAQEGLWQQARGEWPITVVPLGLLPASFIQYRYPRYGWLCQKREGSGQ